VCIIQVDCDKIQREIIPHGGMTVSELLHMKNCLGTYSCTPEGFATAGLPKVLFWYKLVDPCAARFYKKQQI
jgi:hypothetical protein